MARYWVATGKVGEAIAKYIADREEACRRLKAIGRRTGAHVLLSNSAFGFEAVFEFKSPPDLKLWKLTNKARSFYEPRKSSPKGAALAAEIKAATALAPSRMGGADLIGMNGMSVEYGRAILQNPGFSKSPTDGRIFVATPDSFTPTGAVVKDLTRVSDLEAERACKPAKKRAKKTGPSRPSGDHGDGVTVETVRKTYGHPASVHSCAGCGKGATPRTRDHIGGDFKKRGKWHPNGMLQYSCNDPNCDANTGGPRTTRNARGEQTVMPRFHDPDV